MENLKSFIGSGILEAYVMGISTQEERDLVEEMAIAYEDIRTEIDSIHDAYEMYAFSQGIQPDPIVKPFLMATIDFTERMNAGEQPSFPPELHTGSTINDYKEWLNRPDITLPREFKDVHAKIIGYTPKAVTAIVWIKDMAPQEVHDNEYEKFLIVEGTCMITVEDAAYPLVAGDYFSIPLHKNHQVIVTSEIPCKVVLQRIAA